MNGGKGNGFHKSRDREVVLKQEERTPLVR